MSDVLQRIKKRSSWIVGGIFLGLGGGITILSFFAMFYEYNPYNGFFPGCWMLTGGLLFVFVVLPYQEYHEEFRKAICRERQYQKEQAEKILNFIGCEHIIIVRASDCLSGPRGPVCPSSDMRACTRKCIVKDLWGKDR